MCDAHQVVTHLIQCGLLDSNVPVEADVSVTEVSRRHSVFSISLTGGKAFLLKQAADGEKSRALSHEARLYRLFQSQPSLRAFKPHVPEFHDYDSEKHVLVMELVEKSETIRQYLARTGRVSLTLARRQGRVLSDLHAQPIQDSQGERVLPEIKPWSFSIASPHYGIAQNASDAALQCLRLVQRFACEKATLEPVLEQWKSDAIIHGDARFDNWLAVDPGTNRKTELRLIDWELASIGDPCWDIAAVMSDFLVTWVLSIPVAVEMEPERVLPFAQFPLGRLQPGISAFWNAYAESARLGEFRTAMLIKAVSFCGLRLVQHAFEISQSQPQLTAPVVCLLQIAVNILERPEDAAVHLMGVQVYDAEF